MDFKVTISKTSDDKVHLKVVDNLSGIQFVDVQMTLENYAQVITGLAHVPATGEVFGLQYVGKEKIIEPRKVECPLNVSDSKVLRKWLEENCQEDGWILNPYLGSQGSVSHKDGKTFLSYTVVKYVEPDQAPE